MRAQSIRHSGMLQLGGLHPCSAEPLSEAPFCSQGKGSPSSVFITYFGLHSLLSGGSCWSSSPTGQMTWEPAQQPSAAKAAW